jgi:ParB family chromosome partitioning protein
MSIPFLNFFASERHSHLAMGRAGILAAGARNDRAIADCCLRSRRCSFSLSRMARSGLGKGLGALIGTSSVAARMEATEPGERVHQIDLASIVPSALQPRKDFGRDALQELIDSIRQHGILQPLIVRPATASVAAATGEARARFELIAGERRWRAAQELGLATVPAIIRSANDSEVLELSLIENLQRADLNPIEEAQGYARLANEFGMRQEDIALKVGRSRAAVANALRLLDLHPQVQAWLAQNLISVGHAKVLLALKAPEQQLLAAETVLRRNATVRATERLVARLLGVGRPRRRTGRAGNHLSATATAVEDLQNRLQQHLATHVIIHHGEKRGRIEIEYYGADDLQRIMTALGLPQEES